MQIMNNVVKIPKNNNDNLTSEYIEKQLKKRGFFNILRWAIIEIGNDFLKINFVDKSE